MLQELNLRILTFYEIVMLESGNKIKGSQKGLLPH
jgi:hypothetical protein